MERVRRIDWEEFSDAFVSAVVDQGALWLLIGSGVVAVVVAAVQIGMAL